MELPNWIQNTGIIAGIAATIGTLYQVFINKDLKNQNSILDAKVAVMQTQTMHLKTQADEIEKQTGLLKRQCDELENHSNQFEIQSKLMERHNQLLEEQFKLQQNAMVSSSVKQEQELKIIRRKRLLEIQPWFQGIPSSSPDHIKIRFTNEGESAKDFRFSTTNNKLNFVVEQTTRPIKKGERIEVIGYPAAEGVNCNIEEFELEISFSDIDSNIYRQIFYRFSGSKRTSEPELIKEADL